MKSQKTVSLFRGLAALMAVLFVLSSLGQGLTENYRNQIDGMLGTSSYVTINDEEAARFKKDYATIEDMVAAAKKDFSDARKITVSKKKTKAVLKKLKKKTKYYIKIRTRKDSGGVIHVSKWTKKSVKTK